MNEDLFLGFYGDDFTGSTDVMESLTLNGIPAALFLQPPNQEDVDHFRLKNPAFSNDVRIKAFGVAGISRSLTPLQMDKELPQIFEKISRIPTKFFHYKICSTFDSSPEVGNIGHAVALAQKSFPSDFIPLIVGIPLLNRFCVFGNLFARVKDVTFRIDRHPTMSRHPVTPMLEADLRLHLDKQTNTPVHLIDTITLGDVQKSKTLFSKLAKEGGYILFDVLTSEDLNTIGNIIGPGQSDSCQLLVGSSGVEYALCYYWQQTKAIQKFSNLLPLARADRYIVISGSCSPATATQINHGIELGYQGIRMDTALLLQNPGKEILNCTNACLEILRNGGVPLLYTSLGPDDPAIMQTKKDFTLRSREKDSAGAFIAGAQGKILKKIIEQSGKLRVAVAGGDTSGYVTKALGIYALELLMPIAPGSPLCIAHSTNEIYNGLEIALKGGQNGNERFFEYVHLGGVY